MPDWFRRQLSMPSGWWARAVARLLDQANRGEYVAALDRLAPGPDDVVLELGFGGGVGLRMLLARGATVVGVEPAVAMRARALRKHAWDIAEGRLQVLDGRAEALPPGPFDHALSLNTAYFWDDVPAAMAELRRTVRGSVILGIAPPAHLEAMGFRDSGFRIEPPEWYAMQLSDAGFDVELAVVGRGSVATLVVGEAAG
ncbi:MAG: class I SAM-dependent methyltransferase [Myxococcota bacterium]